MCFSCNTIKDNWVITCTHSDCVIFQSTHISTLLIVLLLKAIKVLKCLKITPNHIINRNFSRSVRFLCLTIIILLSHVTLHASINNHWHLSLMVPVPNCIVKWCSQAAAPYNLLKPVPTANLCLSSTWRRIYNFMWALSYADKSLQRVYVLPRLSSSSRLIIITHCWTSSQVVNGPLYTS